VLSGRVVGFKSHGIDASGWRASKHKVNRTQ
jgi:hypothetical protein